jgi:ectoine hydroxylase-related dioxygenase (phytanoyl-CoA dioxygenase family)
MADTHTLEPVTETDGPATETIEVLSEQQLAFFETFGFLRLPGLLADEIADIEAGFEEAFAAKEFLEWLARTQGKPIGRGGPTGDIEKDPPWFETNFDLHFHKRRVTIPAICDRSERLRDLPSDPRLLSIVTALMGPEFEIKASDGNLFYCDTSWHSDMYGAPMKQHHVKLSTYLDPLDAATGAIRLIPGTHFHASPFARKVRKGSVRPEQVRKVFGVEPDELPAYVLESQPGDVVVWDYRTVHAAFNSGERRRLLSLNYGSTKVDAAPGGAGAGPSPRTPDDQQEAAR